MKLLPSSSHSTNHNTKASHRFRKIKRISAYAAGYLLVGLLPWLLLGNAHAVEFVSTSKQIQLIELYTSEGCSSCPPADRWLSTLKNDPRLWREFVPVAFHVDYWDYIGWKDPFADPTYSARQRRHAAEGNVRTVYTPGFVVNGDEWRGWFKRQAPPSTSKDAGVLKITIENEQIHIDFSPVETHQQLIAHIAILGTNISSEVMRGENANRQLSHDFVVLERMDVSLNRATSNGTFTAQSRLSLTSQHDQVRGAFAAWVTSAGSIRPEQAVGGWLE